MISTDIVLKTYPPDYDWLPYLFRSLGRVTGYRVLVVLLEQGYPVPAGLPVNAVVVRTPDCAPGDASMRAAVVSRLGVWRATGAERFFFIDSDCVFTRDLDVQSDPGINISRPVVYWRTWDEGAFALRWRDPARRVLGYDPRYETMCRYPFVFPRAVMESFFAHVGGEARLMALPGITDWNALGNFAIDFHHGLVTPRHWSSADAPCVRQFWSFHRADHPEVQAELKELELT